MLGKRLQLMLGPMETKPKNFLLATDLTSRSAVALRRAARLAAEADGDLTVLSVIERGLPPKIVTRRMADARAEIEADVAALTQPAKERIRVQVIEGEPFSAILGEAYRAFADMIVLGMHAKLGFPELFAGTTTERVLRFADRPVLLVSSEERGAYARVVAAVDRGENAAEALAAAAALAPTAELHVVQAWRRVPVAISGRAPAREVLAAEEQRLRALLEQHVAKCLEGQQPRPSALKLELVEGAAADVIRNAVERLGPDLLSLGANSRSGLAENFIGSTTREFLVHAPCDILVAHVPG
jgi:nucleotide-binding universal stress UspA family protein